MFMLPGTILREINKIVGVSKIIKISTQTIMPAYQLNTHWAPKTAVTKRKLFFAGCYGLQQVQRLSLAHRRQSVVSLWEQSLSQAKPNGGIAAKSIPEWKSPSSFSFFGCRARTIHTRTCTRKKTSRKLLNTRDSGESVSCPSLTVQVGVRSNNIYLQFERAL